jgi:outer membrane usher protein
MAAGAQAAKQALQLEAFINGESTHLIAEFDKSEDGSWSAAKTDLDELGFKVDPKLADANGAVRLDQLPGVHFTYDEAAQAMRFEASASAVKPTLLSSGRRPAKLLPQRPKFGVLFNYLVYGSRSDGSTKPFDGLAGSLESRVFSHVGLLENSFNANWRTNGTFDLTRLDSYWQYDDPQSSISYKVGDVVSDGFGWSRALRLAGIQVRRDFSLRPDIETIAIPAILGTAEAPSALDVYLNGVRALSASVPTGPYEINNPPMIYGGGTMQTVVRDTLGREVVSTQSLYVSPQLLAPGLVDFSTAVGFPRYNYGRLSTDYKSTFMGTGAIRYGLTPGLTLEGHLEATDGLSSVGVGTAFNVANIGVAEIAISGSDGSPGAGGLGTIAFESQWRDFSLSVSLQRSTTQYAQVVSQYEVVPLKPKEGYYWQRAPRSVDQVTLSLPTLWRGASTGISYLYTRNAEGFSSRITQLVFNQNLGPVTLYANAVADLDNSKQRGVFFGIMLPLQNDIQVDGGATYQRGGASGYVEASRREDRPEVLDWRVRADAGNRDAISAGLDYEARYVELQATVDKSTQHDSETVTASGAITMVGGDVFVTPPLDEAFAVVDVGRPGVEVLQENRPAGVTGPSGKLLVRRLSPYTSNRIAIDPSDLPVDVVMEKTNAVVVPYARSPVVVHFQDQADNASALIVLKHPNGKPVEVGSVARLNDGVEDFEVGYDGQLFARGLVESNVLKIALPDGTSCSASFAFKPAPGTQVHVANVECVPSP